MSKKFMGILSVFFYFSSFCFAADEIKLDKIQQFDINYKKEVKSLKGALYTDDTIKAQKQINEQQKADLDDIENLWNSTVNQNPMIGFCLKKLSTPAEQRRIHSSLLAKSMSALISGAALLPSFAGMNYGIQSGAYAAGRIANALINKKNTQKLENPSLTDTEAIELASLIEDLQDEIIVNYFKYKGTLLELKKCREQMLLANKNYSDALNKKNSLDIIINSALWEDELINEFKIKQEIKKYQLALIRLAGKDTVENLNVAQYDLNTQNIKKSDLNYEKRYLNVEYSNANSNSNSTGGGKK